MYHTFKIPKKDGTAREISAPDKELKEIQRKLASVLSAVYEPKVCAYGFIDKKTMLGMQNNIPKSVWSLTLI